MRPVLLIAAAAVLVIGLPSSYVRSQLAPPSDPLAAMQAMQTANDDLLKRQEATLKDLTDLTDTANQIRIFSRRG